MSNLRSRWLAVLALLACGCAHATPAGALQVLLHEYDAFWKQANPVAAGQLGDLREAAANFFRALRLLDDDPRVDTIYAQRVPPHGLGLAINERLERAASR